MITSHFNLTLQMLLEFFICLFELLLDFASYFHYVKCMCIEV